MTMTAPPAKTEISDTYPDPDNATARTGFGKLWDYMTGLCGSTGFLAGMLSASKILDPLACYNLALTFTVGSNALTAVVKSQDGSTSLAAGNPGTIAQRSATVASGVVNTRNITGDITLVVSSGSTLGHASAVAEYTHWYLIDNAGTQELAVSTKYFGKSGIVSTTAEGGAGAADSATTMYSASARSNVPFRWLGRTLDTQTTAGTWTAVPTVTEHILPFQGPIRFPAAFHDDTDVNTLDDYEEGTWTPSVGGSATYTAQTGTYTKIGNRVFIDCFLQINAIGTGNTNVISGLPFTAGAHGSLAVSQWAAVTSALVWAGAILTSGAATITIHSLTAAGATTGTTGLFKDGTVIRIGGSYLAA